MTVTKGVAVFGYHKSFMLPKQTIKIPTLENTYFLLSCLVPKINSNQMNPLYFVSSSPALTGRKKMDMFLENKELQKQNMCS